MAISRRSTDSEVFGYFEKLATSNPGVCQYGFDVVIPAAREDGLVGLVGAFMYSFLWLRRLGIARLGELEAARPGLLWRSGIIHDRVKSEEDAKDILYRVDNEGLLAISDSEFTLSVGGVGKLKVKVWNSKITVKVLPGISLQIDYSGADCNIEVVVPEGGLVVLNRYDGEGVARIKGDNSRVVRHDLETWAGFTQ